MINMTDYGFTDFYKCQNEAEGLVPARVTAVHKERYEIISQAGPSFARLKGATYYYDSDEAFPVAGDFVLTLPNPFGDSVIVNTFNRKSYFSRKDPDKGRGEQAVAANFDYVFIMQSLNHDFNLPRLERYLALAEQSGAAPVIVLTKADLADDYSGHISAISPIAPNTPIVAISAKTGFGTDLLAPYLHPQSTIVLLGSSGVGKSSLVNALSQTDVMDVSEIRENDSRGRHTTTHRQLIMLPGGVMIIDTPGMRELGMWGLDDGLDSAFSDVESLLGQCRFSDCRHQTEPGCAILAALSSGALDHHRWENYNKLQREAQHANNKAAAMRDRKEKFKSMARHQKNHRRFG